MVWNQAPAIREWIMYHSWLGVERWFIYDNNSDDGLDEVIQELDLENYNVTRHVWPWIKTQEAGFSHCAVRAKDECNWISFMDVDEYFYFPYSTPGHQISGIGYASQNSLRALVQIFHHHRPLLGEIRTSCHSFGHRA
ncbi:UNVERIFIED_CONTAM: Glycosyltransferase family 92 protein [Sesamum angustifolium]|uniref:Glycosyltransferase family 92 protein n=1 Tax=Sesamum angustifolium TaxID=2727405 RepID=A0AAW2M7P1_9LAMI